MSEIIMEMVHVQLTADYRFITVDLMQGDHRFNKAYDARDVSRILRDLRSLRWLSTDNREYAKRQLQICVDAHADEELESLQATEPRNPRTGAAVLAGSMLLEMGVLIGIGVLMWLTF